jgi:periplasmic divalent cation tolerance protein
MSVLLVVCSHPDSVAAKQLADDLVDRRLAACVNILPGVRSIYRWEGRVEHSDETLMMIKTTADRFDALKEHIVMSHPHAVPEVLALDVVAGLDRYLDWVRAETMPSGSGT